MKLRELFTKAGLDAPLGGDANPDISGMVYHSRQVCPGDLFVAIPGFQTSGARYIDQAVRNGAAAVVSDVVPDGISVPLGHVENPRKALALLSAAFFDFPARKMSVIGITGTNGKTTVSYFLESILQEAGFLVGVIGTVGARVGIVPFPAALTTPESFDLQRILARMVGLGVSHVVMEVSSHALALDRVTGIEFRGGIFTNLTHDHLDFHGTMEKYFDAKARLFREGLDWKREKSFAALHQDDPSGALLITELSGHEVIAYSQTEKGDVVGKILSLGEREMRVEVGFQGKTQKIKTPFLGSMNLENILAAVSAGIGLGIPLDVISRGVENLHDIPGRWERIDALQPFQIIVDFAHTPDGLEKLLQTVRHVCHGRILLLFGCPGNRDEEKRPMMGQIASRLADYSIITTDDPHREAPPTIAREIEKGFDGAHDRYSIILDRREAIEQIISQAKPGDWVILAGRGHETFQDFNGRKMPLDDRVVVREVLGHVFNPETVE